MNAIPRISIPLSLILKPVRLSRLSSLDKSQSLNLQFRKMSYEIVEKGAPNSLDYRLFFSKYQLIYFGYYFFSEIGAYGLYFDLDDHTSCLQNGIIKSFLA